MESPQSGESETRFNTPVSELDDHRYQPSTTPHIDIVTQHSQSRSRGDTVHSTLRGGRPTLLQIKSAGREDGPISRDFEQAIVDDNRSLNGENVINRLGSVSPAIQRKLTGRRRSAVNRSRESSPSSRSTSPANSVDAFAEPRRRERANTIESKIASEVELELNRTSSIATHQPRRLTPSNASVHRTESHTEPHPGEDDVCFPEPEDQYQSHRIDFEKLDEFVAEFKKIRPADEYRPRHRVSFSTQGQPPKVFSQDLPKIVTRPASDGRLDYKSAVGDEASTINEKARVSLETDGSQERPTVAIDPSRYSFFSSELEQTIHAPELGDLPAARETFRDLFELPEKSGVWWLDVLNPTEDEIHAFQGAFGIHRLTTEDIITQEAREKVELFKQYYFVCFRSFDQMDPESEDYMEPVNIYMVVFREGILTFTFARSPHAANVRKRIGKLRDHMSLTADWICYAMIDNIVDTFGPVISSIEYESDTIEDQVFIARTNDLTSLLRQIGTCRKKVNSLMRLLGGKADVIRGFSKRCNDQYSVTPRGEIGLYLGDIQDHVVTMMSNLAHFDKMLSRSHANYLAQLSVDNIAQGNRANEVLSKITLLATILVPLNLICGLFGMNVRVPGKDAEGLGWFFGIIGGIALFVLGSLCAARRMKFI
ncbi:MAG: hypothetical protein LQ351_002415 [Letrouitia transgressa]|nr:MAG: hypothetical protein LQ351_002415 [Letrouitia transgressa]